MDHMAEYICRQFRDYLDGQAINAEFFGLKAEKVVDELSHAILHKMNEIQEQLHKRWRGK